MVGEVLDAGQEGLRLLRAGGDLWELCAVLVVMEVSAIELGRMQLATEVGEEVAALASRLGHAYALDVAHPICLWVYQLMGNADFDVCEAGVLRHLAGARSVCLSISSPTLGRISGSHRRRAA